MPKKFLKRVLPSPQWILNSKVMRLFGTLLHDPNLWHLNRRSVSWAVAVGLFINFMPPIPFAHTLSVAVLAIVLHFNLPIAMAMLFINNPFTIGPIFYGTYKIGNVMLGLPASNLAFSPDFNWLMDSLHWVWKPFLLGSLLVSVVAGLLGYVLVQGLWRLRVVSDWRKRQQLRRARLAELTKP